MSSSKIRRWCIILYFTFQFKFCFCKIATYFVSLAQNKLSFVHTRKQKWSCACKKRIKLKWLPSDTFKIWLWNPNWKGKWIVFILLKMKIGAPCSQVLYLPISFQCRLKFYLYNTRKFSQDLPCVISMRVANYKCFLHTTFKFWCKNSLSQSMYWNGRLRMSG